MIRKISECLNLLFMLFCIFLLFAAIDAYKTTEDIARLGLIFVYLIVFSSFLVTTTWALINFKYRIKNKNEEQPKWISIVSGINRLQLLFIIPIFLCLIWFVMKKLLG